MLMASYGYPFIEENALEKAMGQALKLTSPPGRNPSLPRHLGDLGRIEPLIGKVKGIYG